MRVFDRVSLTNWFSSCNPAAILAFVLAVMPSLETQAADPPREDKIILMQSSTDELIADMEYMVKTLAKKNKQWKDNIEPNIELFLDGIDRKKPIRVDALFDAAEAEIYRPGFPITELNLFRKNLDALGITSAPVGSNLFRLESAFEGQMRILSKYAIFAPTGWEKLIPANSEDPALGLAPLLKPKYDAGVLIDHLPEGIEDRRKSLKKVRENVLAEIKKKSTESVDEYKLRKMLAENQFARYERLYAELDYLEAGWVTDVKQQRGVGTLVLSALPGTPLAEGFDQIPQLKSRFTKIPETPDFVATGRAQLPVGPASQQKLTDLYNAARPVIDKKIEDNADLIGPQKKAARDAVEKVFGLLEKGFTLGMVDVMGEMRLAANSKFHEALIGIQLVEGNEVNEIVKLLPQISSKFEVKTDVDNKSGFQIHQVTLTGGVPPMMKSLFGEPCQFTVGTSEKLLLVGIGPASLEWLTATAAQLESHPDPLPLPEFVKFKGHMGPFAIALNTREPNPNRPQLRAMLVEAFSKGDDYVELTDRFINKQIHGKITVEPGFLRFLGLAVAKFAEENL